MNTNTKHPRGVFVKAKPGVINSILDEAKNSSDKAEKLLKHLTSKSSPER